jgi:hypothetical protein
MFTRNDSMPNILWIWDLIKFRLTNVLIQTMAIKCKLILILLIYQLFLIS